MDFSLATNEELRAELDGAQKALDAPLGRPLDGREEAHKSKLRRRIAAIQSELEKRNASRS